jgi:hypothetical protein
VTNLQKKEFEELQEFKEGARVSSSLVAAMLRSRLA